MPVPYLVPVLLSAPMNYMSASLLICYASDQLASRGLLLRLVCVMLLTSLLYYMATTTCALLFVIYYLCQILVCFNSDLLSRWHLMVCCCNWSICALFLEIYYLVFMPNTCLLQLPGGISWSAAAIGISFKFFFKSPLMPHSSKSNPHHFVFIIKTFKKTRPDIFIGLSWFLGLA